MNKKVKHIVLSSLIAVVIAVLIFFTYQHHVNAPLRQLNIAINDDEVYSFLQQEDIRYLLVNNKNLNVELESIKTIDLKKYEGIVMSNPWVAKASLFIDNGRNLNVDIVQRIPIARIFDNKGNSYYLDSTLNMMPTEIGFSYPVVVFTNIPEETNPNKINELQTKISKIANYINKDTFWSKQIEQVNMDNNHQFSMATLLGNQRVILGDTSMLQTKFDNLFAFYKQVSNAIGWDKYEVLNLSFINQVVASPALGWVPPKNTDTVVNVPQEINETELLQTLPSKPMNGQ